MGAHRRPPDARQRRRQSQMRKSSKSEISPWQRQTYEFARAGIQVKQSDFEISASQKKSAMSIRKIYLSKGRRKDNAAKVNETERGALRAGKGRPGWPEKTRQYLCFGMQQS